MWRLKCEFHPTAEVWYFNVKLASHLDLKEQKCLIPRLENSVDPDQLASYYDPKVNPNTAAVLSMINFNLAGLYSKTCLKWPLSKRPKISFQDQPSLNAGLKYCRMLQGEHSAILSIFIKLSFVIKSFVLSSFE